MREIVEESKMPEGFILNRWMKNRINDNKNVLLVTVGSTGSGKSYVNLRELELWYKEYFNVDKPPYEHICFSLPEAMRLMRDGNLPKGSMIIIEEAGVLMNSLDFQSKVARFFGYVLQSFRSKNLIVVFNLPNLSFLNKTARLLLHMVLITKEIDKKAKKAIVKPLRFQVNAFTGKVYAKFLLSDSSKIKEFGFSLPSNELIDYYEDKKDKFVNKVMENTLEEMDNKNNKENREDVYNKRNDVYISKINQYWNVGSEWSMLEWSQLLGLTRNELYKRGINTYIGELKAQKKLGNKDFVINSPVLIPT